MKKDKKSLLFLLFALLGMVLCSCTTIQELPKENLAKEPSTAEHLLCRELLMCFLKNDASGFEKRLSPELRKQFDSKKFEETRKALSQTVGEPVSFQYLTQLEFVALTPHIWKVRFRREDKKGREIHSEALFRIITGRAEDGTVLVLGFNFL